MECLFAQVAVPVAPAGPNYAVLGLQCLVSLAGFVCYIIVLVKIFQDNQIGLGIASICCAIIAFVIGWQRASEWGIKNLMIIWTILIVINIALNVAFPPQFPPYKPQNCARSCSAPRAAGSN